MLRANHHDGATGRIAAPRTAIHAGSMTAIVPQLPQVITASICCRPIGNGTLVPQDGGEDSSPSEPCARLKCDALRCTESGYYR